MYIGLVILKILGFVVLIALSATFSGSETALFYLSPVKLELLAQKGRWFSKLTRREHFLPTILFGNTLVNAAASLLFVSILEDFLRTPLSEEVFLSTAILTFIILTFGEFLPKLFATVRAYSIVTHTALPLNILYFVFLPFTVLLLPLFRVLQRPYRVPSYHELLWVIEDSLKQGYLTSFEAHFTRGLIDFHNNTVDTIMTPREKIFALPGDTRIEAIRDNQLKYSRIPVYDKNIDDIVGILYLKDLFTYEGDPHAPVRVLVRDTLFVSSNSQISQVWNLFKLKHIHMAIVRDGKKVVGLVTLDDILRTLFTWQPG